MSVEISRKANGNWPLPQVSPRTPREERLWQLSKELEATFLAEVLGAAGLGAPRAAFGGGAGEEQFASVLRLEQARRMVEAQGIGLAQHLFHSLLERETRHG